MKRIDKEKSVILIQKNWRGFIVRKKLYDLKDRFDLKLLKSALKNHINYTKSIKLINKKLRNKKFRNANFPSEISENIVKYALRNYYKVCPTWDTKKGDLVMELLHIEKTLEVKGFSSSGPASFGPVEKWDVLYFINCKDYTNKKFTVYEINLSSNSRIWCDIKINLKQTYGQVCKQGKRPRITFDKIVAQLKKKYIKIIFDGHINQLL